MLSCLDATNICGDDVDTDDEDEIDFCGMPSQQIVEIAMRREFLLLHLQALVDARTPTEADAALVAMEREARTDAKVLRFLVRAGTVEIIRGSHLLSEGGVPPPDKTHEIWLSSSAAADSLLKKLLPYHEQRQLREMKRRQRGSWTKIIGGSEIFH
mmetsp:Transcript_10613/g.25551  ORF Transcript_10613/g.25551 Transcript_10613/m.25551 type:complete len:156 (+) Transcript_10613:262-729(+)